MSDSKSDELLAQARQVFIRSFAGDFTLPVIARAEGATITDVDGNAYLDFSSGQMCATVGHNHPRIAAAVRSAADRAVHINSAMLSPDVIALGRRVVELLPPPLDKVFFLWRVAPPLTITHAEIDRSLEIIEAAIRAVVGS